MANTITPDFDKREVFATAEAAEIAVLAADADSVLNPDDSRTFGIVREAQPSGTGRGWFYVVVRRRGSHERVGYLAP